MTNLVLPNGQLVTEFQKAVQPEGKAKIHGLSPWYSQVSSGFNIGGAVKKHGEWDDYYDMYRQHAFVRSAIDKIAKTATNAGIDFVPRDSRSEAKADEVKAL